LKLTLFAAIIALARGDKANDCMEIGIGRTSGHVLHTTYERVSGPVKEAWAREDEGGEVSYGKMPGHVKNNTRAAQLLEVLSKELVKSLKTSRVGRRCSSAHLLRGIERRAHPLKDIDQQLADDLDLMRTFRCFRGSPYPNVDGSCTSEESPDLGSVGSKFLRLLTTTPSDDGFGLRESSTKSPLPSARAVAALIRKHIDQDSLVKYSPLFTEFSHLLQRDVFNVPESPYVENIDCCLNPSIQDCAPIPVPPKDPLHKTMPCINFRRAANAQAVAGNREAFNLEPSYTDLSPLYGTSDDQAFTRKTNYFGHLMGPDPLEEDPEGACEPSKSWSGCFSPSDEKTFAQGLRALFALEHNRIADELYDMAPEADDSFLYNEARRISMAAYTSIAFGAFLPSLLGKEACDKGGLLPGTEGPSASYIKEINPGVLVSYAAAAFRNPAMKTEWEMGSGDREEFFGSFQYDAVKDDQYQDLLAIDVQRGRDHGVSGYTALRRFAEPAVVFAKWDDLEQVLPAELVQDLMELYVDLEDVDPMVALLEKPEAGLVGKSFTFILLDQFARLRTGNRYYWEHNEALFTEEQKGELMKANLPALLCNNLPVKSVPTNPFYAVCPKNPLVECSAVEKMDLSVWKPMKQVVEVQEDDQGNQQNGQEIHPSEEASEEAPQEGEGDQDAEDDRPVKIIEVIETVTIEVPAEQTSSTAAVESSERKIQESVELPDTRPTDSATVAADQGEALTMTAKQEL